MTTHTQASARTVAARFAAVALSGALAGVLVAGIGGRVAMRVSALIDPSAKGRLTEAGEVVGRFTLEGTIGLVLFVGLSGGVLVAILWSIVSPWLPAAPATRRTSAFVVAAALGSRFGIDGDNIDFRILDPAWLQATLFVLLAGTAGLVAAWLEPRFTERWADPGRIRTVFAWLVLAGGALLAVPFAMLFFDEDGCGCTSLPWYVGTIVVLLGVLWAVRLVSELRRRPEPPWLSTVGRRLVVLATIAGFVHLAGEISHFA
jgi:hypothetical protein